MATQKARITTSKKVTDMNAIKTFEITVSENQHEIPEQPMLRGVIPEFARSLNTLTIERKGSKAASRNKRKLSNFDFLSAPSLPCRLVLTVSAQFAPLQAYARRRCGPTNSHIF
jgi:hypothetical protein